LPSQPLSQLVPPSAGAQPPPDPGQLSSHWSQLVESSQSQAPEQGTAQYSREPSPSVTLLQSQLTPTPPSHEHQPFGLPWEMPHCMLQYASSGPRGRGGGEGGIRPQMPLSQSHEEVWGPSQLESQLVPPSAGAQGDGPVHWESQLVPPCESVQGDETPPGQVSHIWQPQLSSHWSHCVPSSQSQPSFPMHVTPMDVPDGVPGGSIQYGRLQVMHEPLSQS